MSFGQSDIDFMELITNYNGETVQKYLDIYRDSHNFDIKHTVLCNIMSQTIKHNDMESFDLIKSFFIKNNITNSYFDEINLFFEKYYPIIIRYMMLHKSEEIILKLLNEICERNQIYNSQVIYAALVTRNIPIYDLLIEHESDIDITQFIAELIDNNEYELLDWITRDGKFIREKNMFCDLVCAEHDALYYTDILFKRYFSFMEHNFIDDIVTEESAVVSFIIRNRNDPEKKTFNDTIHKLYDKGVRITSADNLSDIIFSDNENNIRKLVGKINIILADKLYMNMSSLHKVKEIKKFTDKTVVVDFNNLSTKIPVKKLKEMKNYCEIVLKDEVIDNLYDDIEYGMLRYLIDLNKIYAMRYLMKSGILKKCHIDKIIEYCVKNSLNVNLLEINDIILKGECVCF